MTVLSRRSGIDINPFIRCSFTDEVRRELLLRKGLPVEEMERAVIAAVAKKTSEVSDDAEQDKDSTHHVH